MVNSNSIKLGVRHKMSKKAKAKTCCACKYARKAEPSKTYDEWRAEGRQVTIGEKATGWKGNKATFKKSQTHPTVYQRRNPSWLFWFDDFDAMDIPF